MAHDNLPPTIGNNTGEVALLRNRMSEADFERERARLRALYGDSSAEAAAKRDQAMADLFWRSGWTQEDLAAKEGQTQQWVSYRLRFGRFLNFTTGVVNLESLPNNLSEGQFRRYWSQTDRNLDERFRFQDVLELMRKDLTVRQKNRPKIGKELVAAFGDGKWHSVAEMAEDLDVDVELIESTLRTMMALRGTYGARAEKKQVGREFHYRIFKMDRTVGSTELTEKLRPLIKDLMLEGRKNAATASPAAVLILAGKLQKLLDEWAE